MHLSFYVHCDIRDIRHNAVVVSWWNRLTDWVLTNVVLSLSPAWWRGTH